MEATGIREHNKKVGEFVERFKACPDRFKNIGECYTPEEKLNIISNAETLKREGNCGGKTQQAPIKENCEWAGVMFASVNMNNDAREMAGVCGNQRYYWGRARILEEISRREEAIEKTKRELPFK